MIVFDSISMSTNRCTIYINYKYIVYSMECIILVMVTSHSGQSGQYHARHHTRRYEVIKNYSLYETSVQKNWFQ